ncbi:MAG: hypothetical protein N2255_07680 [Kiritimatiellae bacterium]|nr:hypothetical protein [Kiritimatiellia bacterium]
MNLHIDLILPSERRSPGPVSMKTFRLIGIFLAPLVLLLLLAYGVVNEIGVRRQMKATEAIWAEMQSRHRQVAALRAKVQKSSAILSELQGWSRSTLAWHKQLLSLQAEVAPTIQLTSLKVDQTLQVGSGTPPSRLFTMTIRGVARGENPEKDVQALQQRLRHASAFAPLVQAVEVTHYGMAPDVKEHRVFQFVCKYQSRLFL